MGIGDFEYESSRVASIPTSAWDRISSKLRFVFVLPRRQSLSGVVEEADLPGPAFPSRAWERWKPETCHPRLKKERQRTRDLCRRRRGAMNGTGSSAGRNVFHLLERLPESLSECDRRSVGGIGDPASSGRDRRSTVGYFCAFFLAIALESMST
jgi:hypothetical protein